MDYTHFRDFMKSQGFDESREEFNLSCYCYDKGNAIIRTFKLSNGEMVYLEHKMKSGSVKSIDDIDTISKEFNELNIFVKQVKQQLSK